MFLRFTAIFVPIAFDGLRAFLRVASYAYNIRSKLSWGRRIFVFCKSLTMGIKLIKTGDLDFPLWNLWRRLIAGVRRVLWIHWFLLENAILINDSTLRCFLLHFLLLWHEWLINQLQVSISNTRRINGSVGVKGRDRANFTWRLRS